ncbi:hypothetical protein QJS10_CPB17g02553 [Acorus calamus]|uniref:Uncharacterized protein n=1 Tax=Acorus calamus TaxID=4465 RepID=A0AAV9CX89_ACOCL|nr:hypothetical protein QJS10_CPB17g02553 [Acorus calamus]
MRGSVGSSPGPVEARHRVSETLFINKTFASHSYKKHRLSVSALYFFQEFGKQPPKWINTFASSTETITYSQCFLCQKHSKHIWIIVVVAVVIATTLLLPVSWKLLCLRRKQKGLTEVSGPIHQGEHMNCFSVGFSTAPRKNTDSAFKYNYSLNCSFYY